MSKSKTINLVKNISEVNIKIPLAFNSLSAGFPSPALDFEDIGIDLGSYLIPRPNSTYFGKIKGNSMCELGINDGDLIIIDKSIEPTSGKIAVCFLNGEFTLKTLKVNSDGLWLLPSNENYKAIQVKEENDFTVWGIVTHVIKSF